jgi:hypothetical protein
MLVPATDCAHRDRMLVSSVQGVIGGVQADLIREYGHDTGLLVWGMALDRLGLLDADAGELALLATDI